MNKIQTDKILTRSLNVEYAVTIVAINFIFGMVLEVINPQSKNLMIDGSRKMDKIQIHKIQTKSRNQDK